MTYCSKCGVKNPEEARFCNSCGTTLMGSPRRKDPGEECENECSGGSRGMSWFWAAIIIVIGLWLVFEFGIKNILDQNDMPDWMYNCEFWWIIPVIIGIAIIIAGVRGLTRR